VNYAYSLFQEHSLSSGVDVTSDKLMPWFWCGALEQWAAWGSRHHSWAFLSQSAQAEQHGLWYQSWCPHVTVSKGLLEYKAVLLGEWFPTFWRPCVPFEHLDPLVQSHSNIPQKTWIFIVYDDSLLDSDSCLQVVHMTSGPVISKSTKGYGYNMHLYHSHYSNNPWWWRQKSLKCSTCNLHCT
jgi:hypothetical protein